MKIKARDKEATYTGVGQPVTERWTREMRLEKAGQEPPLVRDPETGDTFVSLDFMMIGEQYGRPAAQINQVQIPQSAVPADLVPGPYLLANPTIDVFVTKDGKLRERWEAEGLRDPDGDLIEA